MDWKVGDTVWSIQTWSGVEKGVIVSISEYGARIDLESGGQGGALFERMFKTEEDARRGERLESEKLKEKYRNSLKTKKDVLSFIFHMCGQWDEYTDCEANEVGVEKVREFFGIDIDEYN